MVGLNEHYPVQPLLLALTFNILAFKFSISMPNANMHLHCSSIVRILFLISYTGRSWWELSIAKIILELTISRFKVKCIFQHLIHVHCRKTMAVFNWPQTTINGQQQCTWVFSSDAVIQFYKQITFYLISGVIFYCIYVCKSCLTFSNETQNLQRNARVNSYWINNTHTNMIYVKWDEMMAILFILQVNDHVISAKLNCDTSFCTKTEAISSVVI